MKGRGPLSAPLRALLALALVFAAGLVFHADGAFYRWDTHGAMLRQASVHGILACGMTLVIVTAGIDLAVGSVLALAAVLFSLLTIHAGWGRPPPSRRCWERASSWGRCRAGSSPPSGSNPSS